MWMRFKTREGWQVTADIGGVMLDTNGNVHAWQRGKIRKEGWTLHPSEDARILKLATERCERDAAMLAEPVVSEVPNAEALVAGAVDRGKKFEELMKVVVPPKLKWRVLDDRDGWVTVRFSQPTYERGVERFERGDIAIVSATSPAWAHDVGKKTIFVSGDSRSLDHDPASIPAADYPAVRDALIAWGAVEVE